MHYVTILLEKAAENYDTVLIEGDKINLELDYDFR